MPTDKIERLDTSRIARIMTVALEEFASSSYHQSSYNRIIQRSGISKGTMYYYFRSKEDLFLTLTNAVSKEFGDLFSDPVPHMDAQEDFWEAIEHIVSCLIHRMSMKPIMRSFLRGLFSPTSRLAQHPGSNLKLRIESYINAWLERGQQIGCVRTDIGRDVLLHLIWSLWDIEGIWCVAKDPSRPSYELVDLARRIISV